MSQARNNIGSTSFKELFRRSKFATYQQSVGQVLTTPWAASKRGDFGLKHTIPNNNGKRAVGPRSIIRNLTAPEVDSSLGLAVWKSAEKSARFIRQWGGEGIAARFVPNPAEPSWASNDGVQDVWQDQAGRIEAANEVVAKRHEAKYYDRFIQAKFPRPTRGDNQIQGFFLDRTVNELIDSLIRVDGKLYVSFDLPSDASTSSSEPVLHEISLAAEPASFNSPSATIPVPSSGFEVANHSTLSDQELITAYQRIQAHPLFASYWSRLVDLPFTKDEVKLAYDVLKSRLPNIKEWSRIGTQLRLMKLPYSAWEKASALIEASLGEADARARLLCERDYELEAAGSRPANTSFEEDWTALEALAVERGLTISEWKQNANSWEFELRNVRRLAQAKEEFLQEPTPPTPTQLLNSPPSDGSFSAESNSKTITSPSDGQMSFYPEPEQAEPAQSKDLYAVLDAPQVSPEREWQEIVDYSFRERTPIGEWRSIRAHVVDEKLDTYHRALKTFLWHKARAQFPDWLLKEEIPGRDVEEWSQVKAERELAVIQIGDRLWDEDATKQEWSAHLKSLEEQGKTLQQFILESEYHSVPEPPAEVPAPADAASPQTDNFGRDSQPLPELPDVEAMTPEEFSTYLNNIKRLQPAYRRHLSASFNQMRMRRHRQLAGFSEEDTTEAGPLAGRVFSSYGLAGVQELSPARESSRFLRQVLRDEPEALRPAWRSTEVHHGLERAIGNRHPTGGLQYSLPTRFEVETRSPAVPGLYMGETPQSRGAKLSTAIVGGVVTSAHSSTGYGRSADSGLEPVDLGLDHQNEWRIAEEGEKTNAASKTAKRDPNAGKHTFRVSSASIREAPTVVQRKGERLPVAPEFINKGPNFHPLQLPPLRVSVTPRGTIPSLTAPQRKALAMAKTEGLGSLEAKRSIVPFHLEAHRRGHIVLGSRGWVAGRNIAPQAKAPVFGSRGGGFAGSLGMARSQSQARTDDLLRKL